jgi:lipoprotein-releasing system ATP-binding protein
MNSQFIISGQALTKSYAQGTSQLEILRGIDLQIRAGEAVCIVGASGAGKSTLLHILGTLDRPTSGRLFFKEQNLLSMGDDQLAQFRNESMGFVFQFHHLMAEFTALENVMMPMLVGGESRRVAVQAAEDLMRHMGLWDRRTHLPSELSGGEQQRVAIARALVRRPSVLFADEPTGNLDTVNGVQIQNLFFDLKHRLGLTLVCVTHDRQFAGRFPRLLAIKDGQWF